jgi:hypothetical protein
MRGSLARPPSHEHIDRESRRRTHRWAHRGARRWPWRRHHQRSHGCGGEATIQLTTVKAEQHNVTAKQPSTASHLEKTPGLQTPSNWRGGEDTATGAKEGSRSPIEIEPEQIKPRGRDRLGDARRRWRRTAVKPTNHHGQMEELDEAEQMPHMAMAELAGARRNRATKSPAIRNRRTGGD